METQEQICERLYREMQQHPTEGENLLAGATLKQIKEQAQRQLAELEKTNRDKGFHMAQQQCWHQCVFRKCTSWAFVHLVNENYPADTCANWNLWSRQKISDYVAEVEKLEKEQQPQ